MTTLVVGASGATGRLLVEQLLEQGETVRAVVRRADSLPDSLREHSNLSITEASLLDLDDSKIAELVSGCDAIASCLGHNLTFKGVYGQPRKLVTEATRRLCQAVKNNQPEKPVRFLLMNTTGNRNGDLNEPVSLGQHVVLILLRLLLPPHVDNEKAADFLRRQIGPNDSCVEWVAVRPDGLVDEAEVSDYDLHPSPTRSAIFDAGKTSRINVAHVMVKLIFDDQLWAGWRGKMPVIYNRPE